MTELFHAVWQGEPAADKLRSDCDAAVSAGQTSRWQPDKLISDGLPAGFQFMRLRSGDCLIGPISLITAAYHCVMGLDRMH